MHLKTPRLPPLNDADLTPEQREVLAPFLSSGRPVLNIFRTLAREPEAFKAFLAWGNYILRGNALPPREREIVILRTGILCRSGYEWTQHVGMVRRGGMSEDEIAAIKQGAGAKHWSAADVALVRACDELHERQFVSDETWAALKSHFSEKQCMDVVFTAGQYTQVSMMLNTFGVQLEDGQELDPDLDAR